MPRPDQGKVSSPMDERSHMLLANEQWLHEQYIVLRKTQPQIAREVGCSHGTVGRALARCGIKIRPKGTKTRECPEQLYDEQWMSEHQGLTQAQIVELVGCSTWQVRQARAGWRRASEQHTEAFIEQLRELYVDQGLSLEEVAKEVRSDASTVRTLLVRNDVSIKPPLWVRPTILDNPKRLRELYVDQGITVDAIAAALGCKERLVQEALAKYEIER